MAITMGSEQIVDTTRQNLKSSEVDMGLAQGGASAGMFGGEPLVGITPTFATSVASAINSYVNTITKTLDEIEAKSSAKAFRGDSIDNAVKEFVTSVKEVSMSYLKKLQEAEEQIINSVEEVYSSQDSNLSGNLEGDAGSLTSQSL